MILNIGAIADIVQFYWVYAEACSRGVLMNSILLKIFKNKKVDFDKLRAFGFIYKEGKYRYFVKFFDDQFQLGITIDQEENIFTEVVDLSTGEPYTLFFKWRWRQFFKYGKRALYTAFEKFGRRMFLR